MSRQNRNQERDRKTEQSKRDFAGGERSSRQEREETRDEQLRQQVNNISGLDKHRLNDLYERSSM
jgi:hypothetical protein